MLYGNIFVSHLFCFILCMDQYFIEVRSYIDLSSGHLDPRCQMAFCILKKMFFLDLHFLDQFQDQSILLLQ